MKKGFMKVFSYVDRMKRVYIGECAGSCLVGKPRKRWIDNVKECLKKKGLDVRQTRRMVDARGV